jgi:hypothetical protein
VFYAAAAAALAFPLGGVGEYQVPPASPAPVVSAAAAGQSYGGHTSEGAPIAVRVRGGRVREIVVQARADCESKMTFPVATQLAAGGKSDAPELKGGKLSRRGAFTATGTGEVDLGDQFAVASVGVRGKLGARHSSGDLAVAIDVRDKASGQQVDRCTLGAKWAESVPERRVYAGATSQVTPVVLELSRKRTSVKAFWFGLFAPCTPDGSIAPTDVVTDFRIGRDGRFGDDFSDDGSDGAGGTIHIDYRLHGRVSRSSASGTVEVTAIDRDGQGNTLATCPSGAVRWSTRQ